MEDGETDDYNEVPSSANLYASELHLNGVDQSRNADMQIIDHDDQSPSPHDRHVIHAVPTGPGRRHSGLVKSLQVNVELEMI